MLMEGIQQTDNIFFNISKWRSISRVCLYHSLLLVGFFFLLLVNNLYISSLQRSLFWSFVRRYFVCWSFLFQTSIRKSKWYYVHFKLPFFSLHFCLHELSACIHFRFFIVIMNRCCAFAFISSFLYIYFFSIWTSSTSFHLFVHSFILSFPFHAFLTFAHRIHKGLADTKNVCVSSLVIVVVAGFCFLLITFAFAVVFANTMKMCRCVEKAWRKTKTRKKKHSKRRKRKNSENLWLWLYKQQTVILKSIFHALRYAMFAQNLIFQRFFFVFVFRYSFLNIIFLISL